MVEGMIQICVRVNPETRKRAETYIRTEGISYQTFLHALIEQTTYNPKVHFRPTDIINRALTTARGANKRTEQISTTLAYEAILDVGDLIKPYTKDYPHLTISSYINAMLELYLGEGR